MQNRQIAVSSYSVEEVKLTDLAHHLMGAITDTVDRVIGSPA